MVSFHPLGLLLLPLMFFVLYSSYGPKVEIIEDSRVGIIKRIVALNIDITVGGLAVLPLLCMLTLFIEYLATGQWVWSFQRDTFLWRDIIGVLVMLAGFYCIYFYIKWNFQRGRQTLGQRALGFVLMPSGDKPMLSVRYLVAWVVGAWWPIWPWTVFKKQQDYSWDTISRTKARMVSRD